MNRIHYFKKYFRIIKKLGARFRRHNLSEYSAYSALFIMLSFVPFFILLLNIIKAIPVFRNAQGYRLIGTDEFTALLRDVFSEIDQKATGALVSVATAAALWSASRGLIGIINGLNRIHSAKENRGFLRLRLYSILYTLLLIAVIIITLTILVFGDSILKWAGSFTDIPKISEGAVYSMRWLISFILLVIFFVMLYSALPIKKSRPLPKLPGAVFSAAGWTGFTALYSFYVRFFADFSSAYGSLTVFVLPIIWLYICMYILFLGEEVNVMLGNGHIFKLINDIKPP